MPIQAQATGFIAYPPERKDLPSGHTLATLSIDVPREDAKGDRPARDRVRVSVFGAGAEAVLAMRQGDRVEVAGLLENRRYQKDGAWVDSWQINARCVALSDPSQATSRQQAAGQPPSYRPGARQAHPDTDDIPF